MEEKLPVYVGDKLRCDHCGRIFAINDPVLVDVDETRGSIFCHNDTGLGYECLINWCLLNKATVNANAMRYHGNT